MTQPKRLTEQQRKFAELLVYNEGKMSPAEDFPENSVVCTGTHDNDTLLGWFESLPVKSSDGDMLTQNNL